ncbi:MAG TPA: glutathione transferase GstA [Povalibacter sp.]
MKLFYAPGACSLSPHIVVREADIDCELERVDLKTHVTHSGSALATIHPKNYVPILELDDGQRLTEGAAIVQYLADLSPQAGLIPPAGTLQRYRVQECLNFIASEIHKPFIPLLRRDPISDDWRQWLTGPLARHFDWISRQLWEDSWLTDGRFGVVDAYLFTVLNWSSSAGVDLSGWPVLDSHRRRVAQRPAVIAALQAEGLVR